MWKVCELNKVVILETNSLAFFLPVDNVYKYVECIFFRVLDVNISVGN